MPHPPFWPLALGLFLLTTGHVSAAPRVDPQELAGAFVTMTPGARCPSVSTIAFQAQGEATGPIEGIFDLRGSMDLAAAPGTAGTAIHAFVAALDFNQQRILGTLRWDPADPPLRLVCDALSLRLEGTLRYAVGSTDSGTADIEAYGSRSAVTMPYFGRTTLHLIPGGRATR